MTPNSRTDELLQQILAGQQRLDCMHSYLNVKLDGITNHVGTLETNLEAITLHVRKLDTQVAQVAEAVKRSTGELPGKPEQNPRGIEFVNSVVQNNGERSAQCNTIIAQKQSLGEENAGDTTTGSGNRSFAQEEETPTRQEEFLTPQIVVHDLTRRFKETMSLIPKETTFEEAWKHCSIMDAFIGISPKKELVENM